MKVPQSHIPPHNITNEATVIYILFAGLNFKMQSSFNYLVHGGDSLWKSLFKLCPTFDFHQKISSIAKCSACNFYNLSKPPSILYTRIYCEEIPFLFRIILFPKSKYYICIFKV